MNPLNIVLMLPLVAVKSYASYYPEAIGKLKAGKRDLQFRFINFMLWVGVISFVLFLIACQQIYSINAHIAITTYEKDGVQ